MHVAQRVILVVDGRAEHRTRVRALLEAHGYTVVEADHGAGGLRLAAVVKPDVVVACVAGDQHPNIDFVRALRSDDRMKDVRLVGITDADDGSLEQARAAGCMRCVQHGTEEDQLAAVVTELIGAPPA
jgi:CheY-like chemotaxis protein